VKSTGLAQDRDNMCAFVNPVMNISFLKNGENFVVLYEKLSFLRTLFYITQSINTYIYPVCPNHLTLRYCSLPASQASRAESSTRKYMIDAKLDAWQ